MTTTPPPKGWHTRTEVAAFIQRSPSTISTWEGDGFIKPDGRMPNGRAIYSDRNILANVVRVAYGALPTCPKCGKTGLRFGSGGAWKCLSRRCSVARWNANDGAILPRRIARTNLIELKTGA